MGSQYPGRWPPAAPTFVPVVTVNPNDLVLHRGPNEPQVNLTPVFNPLIADPQRTSDSYYRQGIQPDLPDMFHGPSDGTALPNPLSMLLPNQLDPKAPHNLVLDAIPRLMPKSMDAPSSYVVYVTKSYVQHMYELGWGIRQLQLAINTWQQEEMRLGGNGMRQKPNLHQIFEKLIVKKIILVADSFLNVIPLRASHTTSAFPFMLPILLNQDLSLVLSRPMPVLMGTAHMIFATLARNNFEEAFKVISGLTDPKATNLAVSDPASLNDILTKLKGRYSGIVQELAGAFNMYRRQKSAAQFHDMINMARMFENGFRQRIMLMGYTVQQEKLNFIGRGPYGKFNRADEGANQQSVDKEYAERKFVRKLLKRWSEELGFTVQGDDENNPQGIDLYPDNRNSGWNGQAQVNNVTRNDNPVQNAEGQRHQDSAGNNNLVQTGEAQRRQSNSSSNSLGWNDLAQLQNQSMLQIRPARAQEDLTNDNPTFNGHHRGQPPNNLSNPNNNNSGGTGSRRVQIFPRPLTSTIAGNMGQPQLRNNPSSNNQGSNGQENGQTISRPSTNRLSSGMTQAQQQTIRTAGNISQAHPNNPNNNNAMRNGQPQGQNFPMTSTMSAGMGQTHLQTAPRPLMNATGQAQPENTRGTPAQAVAGTFGRNPYRDLSTQPQSQPMFQSLSTSSNDTESSNSSHDRRSSQTTDTSASSNPIPNTQGFNMNMNRSSRNGSNMSQASTTNQTSNQNSSVNQASNRGQGFNVNAQRPTMNAAGQNARIPNLDQVMQLPNAALLLKQPTPLPQQPYQRTELTVEGRKQVTNFLSNWGKRNGGVWKKYDPEEAGKATMTPEQCWIDGQGGVPGFRWL